MARGPLVHDLGEYDEVWETEVLEELLPDGWKLWRIHRKKDQDTWRVCKDGRRNLESRHFQTVMCKAYMVDRGFRDNYGRIL